MVQGGGMFMVGFAVWVYVYVQSIRPPLSRVFVFLAKASYSLALGLSCFIIVSATMRRWILPVAVLGMLSVKYTCISR
jgi:hypothetical protein